MKHRSKKPLIIVLSCLAALLIAAACLWFFWLKDLWAAAGASPVYVQSAIPSRKMTPKLWQKSMSQRVTR